MCLNDKEVLIYINARWLADVFANMVVETGSRMANVRVQCALYECTADIDDR